MKTSMIGRLVAIGDLKTKARIRACYLTTEALASPQKVDKFQRMKYTLEVVEGDRIGEVLELYATAFSLVPVPEQLAPAVVGEIFSAPLMMSIHEIEKAYILATVDRLGWNKAEAARILKIGVKTIFRKIDEYTRKSNTGDTIQ